VPEGTTERTGAFAWVQEPWGLSVRCRPLDAVARHFFTTRVLRLRGEEEPDGWARVAASIGLEPRAIARVRQVHGSDVIFVRREQPVPPPVDADGLVTDDPGKAVAVVAADCVPLLIADPETGAVAAVHAGWRGTAAAAAASAVSALRSRFGSSPARLVAAIGPSIGPCCYVVGEELIEAFRCAGHQDGWLDVWFTRAADGRLRLDLWRATLDQLTAEGLASDRVHVAGLCTMHHRDRFYSYRGDGPRTGRMAAVIRPGARAPHAPDSSPR
jgi:YfiH family protein